MIDQLRQEAIKRVNEGDFIGHFLPIANANKLKRAMSLKCPEDMDGWSDFTFYVCKKIKFLKYKRAMNRLGKMNWDYYPELEQKYKHFHQIESGLNFEFLAKARARAVESLLNVDYSC